MDGEEYVAPVMRTREKKSEFPAPDFIPERFDLLADIPFLFGTEVADSGQFIEVAKTFIYPVQRTELLLDRLELPEKLRRTLRIVPQVRADTFRLQFLTTALLRGNIKDIPADAGVFP